MAAGDTITGLMGSGSGNNNQWTLDDFNSGKLNTNNFSWGVSGKGVQGQDWGNTNGWTGQQWVDYNNQFNPKPAGSASSAPSSGGVSDATAPTQPTQGTQSQTNAGSASGTNQSNPNTTTATVTSQPPSAGWGGTTQVGITQTGGGPNDPNSVLPQLLMQRAQQGQGDATISPNDPIIKGQVNAYDAEQQRAMQKYLSQQAEAGSPYNTGQQANAERMAAEQAGQNTAQFQADAMTKELANRRQEQQFYSGLAQNDTLARYNTATQNAQFFAQLAQNKDIAGMQNMLAQSQLAQQDKEFLLQLAQSGKYQDAEEEFKRLQLAQDQNQFVAKLAQTGQIAQMDDIFRRMQLAQEESQFLDRLGFDVSSAQSNNNNSQQGG